jgi:hypothetical protein
MPMLLIRLAWNLFSGVLSLFELVGYSCICERLVKLWSSSKESDDFISVSSLQAKTLSSLIVEIANGNLGALFS